MVENVPKRSGQPGKQCFLNGWWRKDSHLRRDKSRSAGYGSVIVDDRCFPQHLEQPTDVLLLRCTFNHDKR